ncbi:MAG: beta-lactamase family protein [Clostridiales bacterium]|nr:beta-lactamase family protein [Clostridiales bacterium]
MDFQAFINDIVTNRWNVHGVEAIQQGQLCYSWGDKTGLHPIYSATKSVLSVAVGIAVDEGRLDLSAPLTEYLPKAALADMTAAQRKAFAPVTLHRLMTMSVKGFPFRAEGNDWLAYSLACPLEHPEIPTFDYSNIPAYLTGVALTHAISQDAGQWIRERIFAPLGIADCRMGRCPSGYFYGASQMELSVESLCKIGLMLMQGGVYQGQRIVSEKYVNTATSVQQMNREGGYGYFFWKYRDGFSINGKWKQKCYVLPKQGLVIGYLSHIEDPSHALVESMEKHLLGIE